MPNRKLKILITGASGFIGKNLIAQTKHIFDFFPLRRKNHDLTKPLKLKPQKIDAIIHLAQPNTHEPHQLFRVHTAATLELLEWGKKNKIKKFIYASTGNVYGLTHKKVKETAPLAPNNFYAAAKTAGEEICWQYQDNFTVNILRFFAPYGENQQPFRLIPGLVNKIKNHEPVIINNAIGNPRVNPIYIDDVVAIINKTIQSPKSFRINVGGTKEYSILEIAELMGELLDKKPVYKIMKNEKIGDIWGDISLMKKNLNYAPQIPLEKGLKKMCRK